MKKISSVEAVRKLAVKFKATFKEGADSGYFAFHNSFGKGSVRGTKIFFGLEVLSFDLTINRPITFDYLNFGESYLHCLFIQEGFLNHSFHNSHGSNGASRFQNVIVGSTSADFSSLELPENTKLKFLLITIEKNEPLNSSRGKLQILLGDVLESLSVERSFSYFGNFSSKASSFVKTVIDTVPNNLHNRLLIEAGILNILSCQFLDHEQSREGDRASSKLSKSEVLNVIRTSEYIANNLDKPLNLPELERESGLNQKRIQQGFKHFFGMSVNKYVVSLRILKAKELIEKTDMSLSEIVYSIGLNSRSYFSRIFSCKYGLLPNEYRKNFKMYNPTYELSYYSEGKSDLLTKDFEDILNESRLRNSLKDITGCLIYHKRNFFQILEGSKEEVLRIYELIVKDGRHSNVTKLYDGFKSGRTFDDWDMAFLEKPALFDSESLKDFRMMNMELILEVNKTNPEDQSNKLRTKLMWERARNSLLVSCDGKELDNMVLSD